MILSEPERQVTGPGGTGRNLKACAVQRDMLRGDLEGQLPEGQAEPQKCLLVWAVPWDPPMWLHKEGPVQKPAKKRPPHNPRGLGHQLFRAAPPFISMRGRPPGSDGHKRPHFTDEETEREEVTCSGSRHSWTVTVTKAGPRAALRTPVDVRHVQYCRSRLPSLPADRDAGDGVRGPLSASL